MQLQKRKSLWLADHNITLKLSAMFRTAAVFFDIESTSSIQTEYSVTISARPLSLQDTVHSSSATTWKVSVFLQQRVEISVSEPRPRSLTPGAGQRELFESRKSVAVALARICSPPAGKKQLHDFLFWRLMLRSKASFVRKHVLPMLDKREIHAQVV